VFISRFPSRNRRCGTVSWEHFRVGPPPSGQFFRTITAPRKALRRAGDAGAAPQISASRPASSVRMGMPQLTRRRYPERQDCWHVYYGDAAGEDR
jgi:hypothetical protein